MNDKTDETSDLMSNRASPTRNIRNEKKICNKTQYLDKNEFKYTNSKNINVENDDENLYILFNENMK